MDDRWLWAVVGFVVGLLTGAVMAGVTAYWLIRWASMPTA